MKDHVEAHAGKDDDSMTVSRKRVASLEDRLPT